MKKRLVILFMIGFAILSSAYLAVSKPPAGAAAEFKDYLIPVKQSTMFFEKKVTMMLITKAELPARIDENSGWMAGIDIDSNQATGGKWPKIGADYILTVVSRNGQWAASVKNVKTGVSKNIDGEVMVAGNKVDFSIPLSELENRTEFKWQIAVVSGDNRKALPDLMTAAKQGQKDANYDDYMKGMKM